MCSPMFAGPRIRIISGWGKGESKVAPCGIGWSYYESLHLNFREDKKEEVAIAGMLAMKPQVLVLDEPTAGLDQRTGWILDRVARAWERIPDDGGSCLSGMEDVAKYVSRLMNAGQGFDGTQEVFKHYKERKGGLSAPQITCIVQELKSKVCQLTKEIGARSCSAIYLFN